MNHKRTNRRVTAIMIRWHHYTGILTIRENGKIIDVIAAYFN